MKRKKVIRLVALMVFSQAVLTVFVSWWLYSQYDKEKTALSFEVKRRFREAEQQVTDSVIFKQYVKPLTIDSLGHRHGQFSFSQVDQYGPELEPDSLRRQSRTVFTMEVNDSAGNVSRHTRTDNQIVFSTDSSAMKEMVVGIKLLLKNMPGDSGEVFNVFRSGLEANPGLFQKTFQKNMEGLGLKIAWLKKIPQEIDRKKGIFLQSIQFKNLPPAEIQGFEKNALKGIWPQMVFGALLVLLTATSFVIAYRGIRSQQRLNLLREDFISNISHELKTPLSTAKVTIEALKTFDAPKREAVIVEYLDIADRELERLDELVTKVLHTGMLENENGFVRLRETELTTLINEVVAAFRVRTRDRKVDIRFAPTGPITLLADPLHVQGVLYNLLDNAIKYNEGENPIIDISLEERAGGVWVKVSDNGPGIHADYRDKVFDKFFRVPSGNVHNVKGHGLGLSYTRQVMHKHGGKVTVQNNPGAGCTFSLWFPKTKTDEKKGPVHRR